MIVALTHKVGRLVERMGCRTHQTQALPRNKNIAQTLAKLYYSLTTFWPAPASSKQTRRRLKRRERFCERNPLRSALTFPLRVLVINFTVLKYIHET